MIGWLADSGRIDSRTNGPTDGNFKTNRPIDGPTHLPVLPLVWLTHDGLNGIVWFLGLSTPSIGPYHAAAIFYLKRGWTIVAFVNIREFKIYDATVAKTSLKIASSRFSISFAIMSVCLTFKS